MTLYQLLQSCSTSCPNRLPTMAVYKQRTAWLWICTKNELYTV